MIPINKNIRPNQVVVKTSRETFVCSPMNIPPGAVIVAEGPDSRILWAQLWALSLVAAEMIKEQL